MYVVSVTLSLLPEALPAFMPHMMKQAENSLQREADCHVFDVCQSEADPNQVFLYEVYTDRAAFDAHLISDHFKAFDTAVSPMITEKTVLTFNRL